MRVRLLIVLVSIGVALAAPAAVQAAEILYPDLKTLSPRNLRFDRTDISQDSSGDLHNVLRFSNTVVNEGEGPVEIRALIDQRLNPPAGPAYQRLYDDAGGSSETQLGSSTLYYHAVHVHYHFDNWGEFQLWTKPAYDAWIASGRTVGTPDLVGQKTTSCVMDEEFVTGAPPAAVYPDRYPAGTCMPNSRGVIAQGLSSGWGDTYDYYRFEQWIDLGQSRLADGEYVLRTVTDPLNLVYESPGKANVARENQLDNEATTTFVVSSGRILDSHAPTGTVTVNRVDPITTSPLVNVNVLGRDDVSGVTEFRVTTDHGSTWKSFTNTSRDSNDQRLTWDLSDPAYGGSGRAGTRTVCVLFKDATGKWGPLQTDTIDYQPPTQVVSAYGRAVQADAPVAWWRLGEASGTAVLDQAGGAAGSYAGGVTLGQPSLVPTDPDNKAVAFNGTTGRAQIPASSALNLGSALTLEAWVKPTSLPASGSFRAILSKPESYTLQFNGPRLEFTVIQNGTRRRVQAPAGAVVAGSAYHVAATYDGTTQRLYLNGSQVASTALTGGATTTTSPLFLGAWDESMEYLQGTIDEAAVYNRPLSAAQVRAHYDAGAAAEALPAPSNLAGRADTPTQVDLSWADNATSETGHVIERAPTAAFSSVTTFQVGANVQSFSDTGLVPNTGYWYRVKAVSGATSSGWSNAIQVTTPTPSTYAALIESEHPVSWWRLGETSGTIAGDQTVVGPGTFLGSPILGVPSLVFNDPVDPAVGFNGATSDIRVGQTGAYDLTNALSLEAWVKPTTLPATGVARSIVAKPGSWALQLNGSSVAFTVVQAGVRQVLKTSAGAVAAGSTFHVAATFDGSTQRIYVNGVLAVSRSLAGVADLSMAGVRIGSWDGTQELFAGTIDEPAIYGRVLSAAQLAAHHAAAKTPLGEPTDPSATAAGSAQVDLAWTDNATTETALVVQRSTTADFAAPVSISLPANARSWSDTGRTASTTYWYRVRAVTASDSSPWSPVVQATTATPAGYAAVVAADGPAAWWRLGEASGTSVADQTGGAAGTASAGTTRGQASLLRGDPDAATLFNGSSGYVQVPNSARLGATTGLTVEAWIKPTRLPATGAYASLVSKPEAYTLQFNGARLELTIVQSGARRRLQAPVGAIVTGATYHVAGTYDGTTQRLYVNGMQVASVALRGSVSTTTYPLFLGAWSNAQEFFSGTIDEPAVYTKALTAAQVRAHHAAGVGG